MEKQKREEVAWKIAIIHCLTAGFVMPLIISFIGAVLLTLVLPTEFFYNFYGTVSTPLILNALGIYFGVLISVKFLNKTYIMTDKVKIINLSTIYTFIVTFVLLCISFTTVTLVTGENLFLSLISLIVTTVLFYIFSKKYLSKVK
jgi:hypothetical protein